MDCEMPRSRGEQEAGADSAQRHRQGLQPLQADEGEARRARRRRSRVAADHRPACRPAGNRTASRRLNISPASPWGRTFLLKHVETRRLVAVTGSLLPLWESYELEKINNINTSARWCQAGVK